VQSRRFGLWLERGLQPLQRGAEVAAERDPRCVGHGTRLQFSRPPRRFVGPRADVLHRLNLGLLGPGCDLGFDAASCPASPLCASASAWRD
jgi:hypothetical protein